VNFDDPSFNGEGRRRPPGRPNPKQGDQSFPDLNYARGTRIRVLKDNGTRGLLGLEGVVIASYPGGVVVELEKDPLIAFRAKMAGGITFPSRQPQRNFRVTEVEAVSSPRAQ
jgi:hypothetical protein